MLALRVAIRRGWRRRHPFAPFALVVFAGCVALACALFLWPIR